MTEQKKPCVGEFWRTRGGERRYVAAVLPDLVGTHWPVVSVCKDIDYQTHTTDGYADDDEHKCDDDLVTHLHWCTSFDDAEPVAEVWPKWYVNPYGFADGTACIRRDNAITACCVSDYGKESPMPWRDVDNQLVSNGSWREITESEALARLQIPAPACPDCSEPFTAGHADVCPMAWVVQDRVPYRDGVDQWKLEWGKLWVSHGQPHLLKMHGEGEIGYRYEVRTRRKDLPQLSVETCAACDQPAEPGTAGCREHSEYAADIERPSTPDPGEGWRLLECGKDRRFSNGDQYWWNGEWHDVPRTYSAAEITWNYSAYRRRIAPECTCPQPGVVSLDCPTDGLGHGFSEPDTVPVRLWINEEDGVVFQSDVQVLPGDQEILIVGNEFRVRKAVQG